MFSMQVAFLPRYALHHILIYELQQQTANLEAMLALSSTLKTTINLKLLYCQLLQQPL